MVASTSCRVTTNHDAIRCWAEERSAKPVQIARGGDDNPGTVRLEFPGSRDNSSREIGWEQWFQKFDRSKLALLYQEQTANGERSSFCQIVRREKADEVENALGGRGRSAARRGLSRAEKLTVRAAVASEDSLESNTVPQMAAMEKGAETTRRPETGDDSSRRQEGLSRVAAEPGFAPTPSDDGKDNRDGARDSC